MIKSQNRYRRKRVKTIKKNEAYFPWIGITETSFNLFSDKPKGLLNTTGSAYGDGFFWQDPKEVEPSEIQPLYFSYKTDSTVIFESYLPKIKQRSLLKTTSVNSNSAYFGGTCFFDSSIPQVTSAFETSTLIPWEGDRGSITGVVQGFPVGASCFTDTEKITSGSSNSSSGDGGQVFYSSQIFNTDCSYLYLFRDSFTRTTSVVTEVKEEARPLVAGEFLTLFQKQYTQGELQIVEDSNVSEPVFGNSVFILSGEHDQAVLSGAKQVSFVRTTTNYYGLWPSEPNYYLSAYDPVENQHSDSYPLDLKPSRDYNYSLSTFPTAIGDTVVATIPTGGLIELEYKTEVSINTSAATGLEITTDYVTAPAEVDPNTPEEVFTIVNGNPNLDFIMQSGGGTGNICNAPSDDPGYTDPWINGNINGNPDFPANVNFYYIFTPINIPARDFYKYQANPILTEESFTGQWVLVVKDVGKRFFLSFVSSNFAYAEAPADSEIESTAATLDLNGTEITLQVTEVQDITWDSVAGDLDEMPAGSFKLYVANSPTPFVPENTQLFPNNYEFIFTITTAVAS